MSDEMEKLKIYNPSKNYEATYMGYEWDNSPEKPKSETYTYDENQKSCDTLDSDYGDSFDDGQTRPVKNRFDLEQQILACWNIVDEINLLYEVTMEGDSYGTSLTKDELANVLLGLQQLYALKFQKLFSIFDEMIQSRSI